MVLATVWKERLFVMGVEAHENDGQRKVDHTENAGKAEIEHIQGSFGNPVSGTTFNKAFVLV
jgi:hypothetical protein